MRKGLKFYHTLLVVTLLSVLFYCKKEETKTAPVVSITAVSGITANSASTGGNVSADGGASVTIRGVCWSTSQNPSTSDSKTSDGSGVGSFSSSITGLNPGVTYTLKAYAINSVGTSYSGSASFSTTAIGATLTTVAATSISSNSASSGGNISSDGGSSVTARGVCWSIISGPTTSGSKTSDGTGIGNFTSSISGLTPGTVYYARAYAINSAGTAYGNELTITTTANLATIATTAVTSITSTTATGGGNISADGGGAVTAKGICWSTTSGPTISNSKTNDGSGTGAFISSLTGLNAGTLYYVRAYATNSAGTTYGNEISFSAKPMVAMLTTIAIASVAPTTANSGGNITNDGGAAITARGVCWNTSTSPTTSNNKTSDGTGIGNYTSSISGLTPVTIYYIRAYAINGAGTAYGNELTFTTGNLQINSLEESVTKAPGEAPDFGLKKFYIITGSFSVLENAQRLKADLIAENFNAGIFINNNGMYRVSCYSSDDESVTRTKCAEIIQLFPKYSDLWLLIKKESNSITDIDGNIYSAVTIGTQIWMTENLKVTKYNDGTGITNVTDNTAWANLQAGAYCWYENYGATYKSTYGALYNWFTVNTGKLCPIDWHVPSDAEWTIMTTYLGGSLAAGGKLKETGTTHWAIPNAGATNITGFTAVPGGYCYITGLFYNIGIDGRWWSSTEDSATKAWDLYIFYDTSQVLRNSGDKKIGFSVRCLKN
ncbi:MAG: SPOR domain-containing protein [Bacteroidia bacterium]|nr:SPOR domain-containing protein [Bacteroidia bacterium]